MRSATRRCGKIAAAFVLLCSALSQAQVSVTTFHNDNSQTGQNTQETILTPANVNAATFGKKFSVALDGAVYAQPLVLANVAIGGGTHDVAYAATEHDSVYAIGGDTGKVYWQKSLIPAGGTTVNATTDLGCGDIRLEIGITGTPVIDPATGTLYVVAKSKVNGVILQYLHALDVVTGAEKFGGPVKIEASVPGTANDGDGTTVTFNSRQENQRAGLMLENGHVIVAFASHCDISPWHGWMLSYSAGTLALEAAWNSSANGYGSGIWFSGGAPSADAQGNIYVATGNGSWNGTSNLGDSIVKLGPPADGTFPVLDYFTPYNQGHMQAVDDDLGSGGMILLPKLPSGKQLLTLIGKEGTLYLVDNSNLGKYCVNQTPACTNTDPQIVQRIAEEMTGIWGGPAYWNGHLYWAGSNDQTRVPEPMKSFSFGPNAQGVGQVGTTPSSISGQTFTFSGPYPVVSSNGTSNGIVWGLDNRYINDACTSTATCQVLYAYDANDLTNMLYNSNQAANMRDAPGGAIKFTAVAVANGRVYVPSQSALSVFGLLDTTATAAVPTFSPAGGTYTTTQSVTLADTTAGAVIYYTLDGSTPTTSSTQYTGPLTVASTTTIKALAAASGDKNSAVASAAYTVYATGTTWQPVSLTAVANVYGIVSNGAAVTNGGLDGFGDALSANLLGTSVTWGGTTFTLGAAGTANVVSNTTIPLTSGSFTTLNLLATGVRGNQVNQNFVVTYTDGTTTTFQQSLSDWFTPQGYKGESTAVSMAYEVTGTTGTTSNGPFNLYGYSFALNSAKTVKSLTLPGNRDVVVVAVALGSTTTTTPPSGTTPVSLTSVANVSGIVNNGSPVPGFGLDGLGDALSANLLGSSVSWGSTTFTLGAAGVADAVSNATIPLTSGSYTTLNLLATGVRGNQANQTFVVTYTDGTTTTVHQSLSDWYSPQSYTGESTAVTMAYRVSGASGVIQTSTPLYLYGYSFAINSAKTVKSLTLPANRDVVVLAVTLGGTAAAGGGATSVSLTAVANDYGMFTDGSVITNGGTDGLSYAYSKTLLGNTLTWAGSTFNLGAAGVADAVHAATVPLPAGNFATLQILATAVRGNALNQVFTVTYTDGTTTAFTQSLSDWFTPQSYAGESTASTMTYRLMPNGSKQTGPFYLYGYSFTLNSAKTVKSLTLPGSTSVVVFAANLSSAALSVPLGTGAAVYGLGTDGTAIPNGGLDGLGNAYSATLLGTSQTVAGVSYTLLAPGQPSAIKSATVALPSGKFSTLKMLGTGVTGGAKNQSVVVTYSDGTTTTFTQSFSDWYTAGGYAGETKAISMAYRLVASGAKDPRTFYLSTYSFALNNAKTVTSVTLPATDEVATLAMTLVP